VNYRHAFHAGNVADCMKHALLVWLLEALRRKPAPFAVLDTHAGAGIYDLSGPAERTGEWRAGIARLLHDPPPALVPYVRLAAREGAYPGSPVLIRALLRPDDRLTCCELHPEEAGALKRLFARDRQVAVHERDGWSALTALLPPATAKRGLVLIDPPYEAPGEHARVAAALGTVAQRFPQAVVAAWYPVKHRAPVRALHEAIRLAAVRDVVVAELWLREPTDPARLNGSGLLIRNPPYRWDQEWPPMMTALLDRLGDREPGEGWSVARLTDE
jgi:23S rRNA (adenine2030-N6)-methyltransferase